MPGKFEAPRRRSPLPLILLVLLLVAAVVLLAQCVGREILPPETVATVSPPEPEQPAGETTALPEIALPSETAPPEERITVTLSAQGDLLMHRPIFTKGSYVNPEGAGFDFSSLFRYLGGYISGSDYAVANLETTLGGDSFPYQGNPSFNCPDGILDAVKGAGYDMLLTANNHSYDTLMTGIDRTLDKTREAGLDTLGTRLSGEENRYSIVEVGGIRLGLVCYTYTMTTDGQGRPSLNNNAPVENPEQINWFSYRNLNKFYTQMEQILADMEAEGAEATVLFLHWGTEYELVENETQRTMAQKLCDLGIDVIIGGHPHVVQPMDLLESSLDPEHKTVCIYSLGNAVSNQRREQMRLNTGHTEDGVIFYVTFEKDEEGLVRVADTYVVPTWVDLHSRNGRAEYNILPLDKQREDSWQKDFGLSDETFAQCQNSWERTMKILSPGLEKCQKWLDPAGNREP